MEANWTDEENTKLAALWNDGKTFSEMSEELGRSRSAIHRHSKTLRSEGMIKPRKDLINGNSRLWDDGENAFFALLWNAGSTLEEISAELGRDKSVVHRHAKELRAKGMIKPRKRVFGKAHIASVQADLAERGNNRLTKLAQTFSPGPVTDRKREVALTLHAGEYSFKHIAETVKMTHAQLAIVLRVPAPCGPHIDLGKANAMHRLDLLLTGRSGYPEYDIPPDECAKRYPMHSALLSCVGSQAAMCVDNG